MHLLSECLGIIRGKRDELSRVKSRDLVVYGIPNHYQLITCMYDDNCVGPLKFQVPV